MGNTQLRECKDVDHCELRYTRNHICGDPYDHDPVYCYRRWGSDVTQIHLCAEQFCGTMISHMNYERDGPYCPSHATHARRCQICHHARINIRENDGLCHECRVKYCDKCGTARSNRAVLCDDCEKPCHGECGWRTRVNGTIPPKERHKMPAPCVHHAVQLCVGLQIEKHAHFTKANRCWADGIPYPGPVLCKKCQDAKPQRLALIAKLQACDA